MMKEGILHGTAVALHGGAVFLRGPSGSGKSDLALRLMAMGGELVADDQVEFRVSGGRLFAAPPETLAGVMEVRGVGLVKCAPGAPAPVRLAIDLVPRAEVPRLPDWGEAAILSVSVPLLKLHAFDVSTPLKIEKALELVDRRDLLVG